MNVRLIALTLLIATGFCLLTEQSFADDRSIYNRTGGRIKLSLTPTEPTGETQLQSSSLNHNQEWNVDLSPGKYRCQIEDESGKATDAGIISFEDPRKNVANLVKYQTKTTVPQRNPVTGDVEYNVITNYWYSFVYGASSVDQNGLRFGVTFIATTQGIHVTQVHPNMPSKRCLSADGQVWTLVPGDVIISINGKDLKSADDMLRAVAASPRNMEFRVIDGRTGVVSDLKTELAW